MVRGSGKPTYWPEVEVNMSEPLQLVPSPVRPAEPERKRATDADRQPVILVVDDEPAVRRLVVRALAGTYDHLLEAASGADAIEVAERHAAPIDLLVTDLKMPNMDGRALAQALRTRYRRMKILFFSGYSGDLFRDGELLPMGVAYLDKPVVPQALLEAVHLLLYNTTRPQARAT